MSATRVVLDALRDAKVKSLVVLSLLGLTAGVGLLTAGAALAVTGSEPGNLSFNPPSGATTLSPTWSTTDGCPVGFQGSAVLFALNTDGSIGSSVSPTVANVTTAFSGTLLNLAPIGQIISLGTNVRRGGTSEFVVACSAERGGLGNRTYVQAEWVTLSANGSTYTTSSRAPASPTSTGTPTPTPTSTVTATGTPAPNPSGAAATGGGRAALSGDGTNVQLGFGAAALAGSAAAMALAFRRARRLPGENGLGRSEPGEKR